MSLRLKPLMAVAGIKQAELADAACISRPALSSLINHDLLPARYDRALTEARITEFLSRRGCVNAASWKEEVEPSRSNATAPDHPQLDPLLDQTEEIETMLLRYQPLTPQAKRHFGLTADPFADPTSTDEVFLSPDIRYVRETMFQTARHGGFLAVVGESGAGKTTLHDELVDRIQREAQSVVVIKPYVLGAESDDKKGKTLRSLHIAEAIMSTLAPMAKTKSSPEARFRQIHETLRDSARAGNAHVLIIEEAHSLPLATLKHLKRFRELKDGLRPLLSIILIGQPELRDKLSEQNPEVREVVQRIEVITLPSLGTQLKAYLEHRFKRVGGLDKVMEAGAETALRARLTPSNDRDSLLYPLAVHNALSAAMNRAADLGVPLVTADVVKGI